MATTEVKFISTGEAARLLGISQATIQRYADAEKLICSVNPVTRTRRIDLESVLGFASNYGIRIKNADVARCLSTKGRWNLDGCGRKK